MAEDLKTGFSRGVSSENSPQMTDTTSGSHAPPMVTVKTRRLDAGKQSAARATNGPHQGEPRCPAAPAIQPKPEAYDLSSGDADAQSVRSSVAGRAISVASSTAELLATRALLKQKRVAAEAAAAVEAAKIVELEIDVMIAAIESQQSHTSESAESLDFSASPQPQRTSERAAHLLEVSESYSQEVLAQKQLHENQSLTASCPAAESNELRLWGNPFAPVSRRSGGHCSAPKSEMLQTAVEDTKGVVPLFQGGMEFPHSVEGSVSSNRTSSPWELYRYLENL